MTLLDFGFNNYTWELRSRGTAVKNCHCGEGQSRKVALAAKEEIGLPLKKDERISAL